MDLKVGDTVKLKGGGPLMTVETLSPPEDDAYGADGKWVGTVWFERRAVSTTGDGWDGPNHGVFSHDSLEAKAA